MGSASRFGRIGLALVLAATGMGALATSAGAAFHLMKIREVYRGNDGPPSRDDAFIELQMYQSGQNLVAGKELRYYNAAGTQIGMFPFPANVPNADSQRSILVGDTQVTGADFTDTSLSDGTTRIQGAGGALCFVDPPATFVDCVAWAGFSGALPVGTPASPGILPDDGRTLERTIAPNCPTLLEASDDTDDSATDFSVLPTPTPRNNATAPSEVACSGPGGSADTRIDKGPKKKTRKKRATFEFSSPSAGATFECEVDGGKAFTPCTSPFTTKVKKGKHTFKVRAVLGGVPDGSPAEYKWRVKKKRKK